MKTQSIKINDSVRDVLQQMRWTGNTATMPILERKLYAQVNEVLEICGGKWNRKSKCHIFDEEGQDRIAQALELGEILDEKKTFQFFPTPSPLADRMVEELEVRDAGFVLEPSCGTGSLVGSLLRSGVYKDCIIAIEINPTYADKCAKEQKYRQIYGDKVDVAAWIRVARTIKI